MALRTVPAGAPAKKTITPIPTPTSRGLIESVDRELLLRRTKDRPSSKAKLPDNGFGTGSSVGGATPVKGASV